MEQPCKRTGKQAVQMENASGPCCLWFPLINFSEFGTKVCSTLVYHLILHNAWDSSLSHKYCFYSFCIIPTFLAACFTTANTNPVYTSKCKRHWDGSYPCPTILLTKRLKPFYSLRRLPPMKSPLYLNKGSMEESWIHVTISSFTSWW